jgi:Outer membrane protein beta-barrel domain
MKRSLAILVAAVSLLGSAPAFAQEAAPGAGRAVITIIPAGGTFFTEGKDLEGPSFGNYDIGGAVAFNFNRYVGVEGEVSGALGVSQSLQFAGTTADRTTPHLLNYSGNLVVSAPNRTSVVPYLTGGVGGLSLFEKEDLGITGTESFLTGNVGGGLAWYAGRWGLRGDYRFIAVRSKDDAPVFFGRETRYGHRVYAGVIVNVN